MKRIFSLFLAAIAIATLAACGSNKNLDQEFDLVFEEISVPAETAQNLSLPTTSQAVSRAVLSWDSSLKSVITNSGVVIRQGEDKNVTLTLKVKIDKEERDFQFTVKVLKKEDVVVPPEPPVPAGVSHKLDLSTAELASSYVTALTDTTVKNLINNANVNLKRIHANISKLTDSDIVGVVTSIRSGNNFASPSIQTDFIVYDLSKIEFTFYSWTTDAEYNLESHLDKMLVQTSTDGTTWTDIKDITNQISKDRSAKHEISVELDTAVDAYVRILVQAKTEIDSTYQLRFVFTEILLYGEEAVLSHEDVFSEVDLPETTTENLTLITESELIPEAILEWSSSHPESISIEGVVTRGEEDVIVTLTLTVTIDGQVESNPFVVKVLKEEVDVPEPPVPPVPPTLPAAGGLYQLDLSTATTEVPEGGYTTTYFNVLTNTSVINKVNNETLNLKRIHANISTITSTEITGITTGIRFGTDGYNNFESPSIQTDFIVLGLSKIEFTFHAWASDAKDNLVSHLDKMLVQISTDGGITWINVEDVTDQISKEPSAKNEISIELDEAVDACVRILVQANTGLSGTKQLRFVFTELVLHGTMDAPGHDDVFAEVDLPEETMNDLDLILESAIVPEAVLEWSSSHPDIINISGNKGVVTRPNENQVVTLTLKVTIGDEEESFPFEIMVLKKENEDTAEVSTYEELLEALNNPIVSTIKIFADIELEEQLIIRKDDLTIIGNQNRLSIVDQEGWDGNYLIQVYQAINVLIKDIQLVGGDAAILVNGSEVTVENIILSEQEFGGIEVSQGLGVSLAPKLTVEGEFEFDANRLPAIWIDGKSTNDAWVIDGDLFNVLEITGENAQLWFVTDEYEFTISFVVNGGVAIDAVLVKYGLSYTLPENPVYEGHVLEGWYDNPGFTGDNVVSVASVTSDMVFYAKWEERDPLAPITSVTKFEWDKTGNMTGNNDAALLGLDPSIFNAVGVKNGHGSLLPGLVASGPHIGLYAGAATAAGNGNSIEISVAEAYQIVEIKITFGVTTGDTRVIIGLEVDATLLGNTIKNGVVSYSSLAADSFVIKNVNMTNVQVHVKSIEITYKQK